MLHGKMLHGQKFTGQMFPRKLTTRTYMASMVKMGLVSAEIFQYIQTRTSVAWTNVDSTNVPETVNSSYRWPNHPNFKVWLSPDQ